MMDLYLQMAEAHRRTCTAAEPFRCPAARMGRDASCPSVMAAERPK
jgi:hypothetical protein